MYTHRRDNQLGGRVMTFVDACQQDIRFAVRLLAKDRSVTCVAAVALALGIGVNNTMFSIVNAYCLRGLPIDDPDRIVYVATRDIRGRAGGMSYPDVEDVRASATRLSGLAAFAGAPVAVRDERQAPDRFQGTYISANAFRLIGETPALGRDFRAEDDRPGAPPVVIISGALWKSRYGGDPAVLGRAITINGVAAVVVGAMRDRFGFPNNADLWQPLGMMPGVLAQPRDVRTLGVFGRLADGATFPEARTELETIGARMSRDHAATNEGIRLTVVPINERYMASLTHPAWLAFLTAGGLIVLIACANVANLLLARSAVRSREMAIRASLGATRGRIVRQMMVESGLLALLGGAGGIGVSLVGLRLMVAAIPAAATPYWLDFSMDGRVFAVLAAVCLGTVFVFGLVPALHGSMTDVNGVLKEGGRGTGGFGIRRWTSAFLAAEFALTMVLLAALGLSVRNSREASAEFTFDASHLLTMLVSLPVQKYPHPAERVALYDRLDERLQQAGGISSAAIASHLPFGGAAARDLVLDDRPAVPGETPPAVRTVSVGDAYFRTLGVALRRGRAFTRLDGTPGNENAIVNQRFVDMYLRDEEPIGRRIRFGASGGPAAAPSSLTIVGVSPTLHQRPRVDPDAVVYLPVRSDSPSTVAIIVRSELDPAALTSRLREEVRALDSDLPLYRVLTMEQAMAEAQWNSRVAARMITIIASIALALSAVGLFAVTARAVAQRTQEIGVRMALGARPRHVGYLVLRRAFRQLGLGLAAGVACTYAWDKMFGTGGMADPTNLLAVAALMTVVATIACLVPARRATRLDPVSALRWE
jgi:putative ABC transport system permease protein